MQRLDRITRPRLVAATACAIACAACGGAPADDAKPTEGVQVVEEVPASGEAESSPRTPDDPPAEPEQDKPEQDESEKGKSEKGKSEKGVDGFHGPLLPAGHNYLRDGSFDASIALDDSERPWINIGDANEAWAPFEVVELEGNPSVRLSLRSQEFPHQYEHTPGPEQGASGCAQSVDLKRLPRYLRGRVFLEKWTRGTSVQYYEILVTIERPGNFGLLRRASIELSFVIGGVRRDPVRQTIRKYEFTGPRDPSQNVGEWQDFEFDLHEAFEKHWKRVPVDFKEVRLRMAARFDSPVDASVGHGEAIVYFDDLYLGD